MRSPFKSTPSPTSRKILERSLLARRSAEIAAAGGALVLTNGCFDILHVGHVRYLSQARSLGTALAVALNSDASVRRLKGPARPMVAEADRAEVLAALECVDFVTIFEEDTAEDLVRVVRPAVYVKGGDYSPDPEDARFPIEGRVALAMGARVHIMDMVPGRSSTALIDRLIEGSR